MLTAWRISSLHCHGHHSICHTGTSGTGQGMGQPQHHNVRQGQEFSAAFAAGFGRVWTEVPSPGDAGASGQAASALLSPPGFARQHWGGCSPPLPPSTLPAGASPLTFGGEGAGPSLKVVDASPWRERGPINFQPLDSRARSPLSWGLAWPPASPSPPHHP